MKKPVLIHLPHCSINIPFEDRNEIQLNDFELQKELLKLTDRYTDELFAVEDTFLHKAQFSRMLFDPERFRNDKDEMMAEFGMGAIYTHTEDRRLMRNLTAEKREEMMRKYYDTYHLELEGKVKSILETYGKCLIIDGHSFPEKPLCFEADKNPDRPDICIGTCSYHTPEVLVEGIESFVKANKMTVKRNIPFAGTMVPMEYYLKNKGISSVMIEVNRRLYMDESTGEKLPCFQEVKAFVQSMVSEMIGIFETL